MSHYHRKLNKTDFKKKRKKELPPFSTMVSVFQKINIIPPPNSLYTLHNTVFNTQDKQNKYSHSNKSKSKT